MIIATNAKNAIIIGFLQRKILKRLNAVSSVKKQNILSKKKTQMTNI